MYKKDGLSLRVKQAIDLLIERCVIYTPNYCQHFSVRVYTSNLTDIDKLKSAFGGKRYHHLKTFVWILGKRKDQISMLEMILPFLKEAPLPRKLKFSPIVELLLPGEDIFSSDEASVSGDDSDNRPHRSRRIDLG